MSTIFSLQLEVRGAITLDHYQRHLKRARRPSVPVAAYHPLVLVSGRELLASFAVAELHL